MTLQAMEARRLLAATLFAKGWGASRVAREVGVSPQAAWEWQKRWREGGAEALRSQGRRGRKASLGPEELGRLEALLLEGPKAQGYTTDLWTLPRIAKLIRRRFGVSLSSTQVWRILHQMGWSCQKPARRAKERDEERIATWHKRDWPRIKRGQNAGAR